MRITMEHAQRLTLVEMREFVASSGSLSFTGAGRKEIYGLVECTLQAHEYLRLAKKNKGVVRRYLAKISGRSLAQITRLIRRYRQSGAVQPAAPRRHRFPRRYTQDDIALLATVDAAHEGLSGPALRRILWREYHVYGKAAYRRLASLSASHIYNLRRTAAYRQHHVHHTRTRSRAVAIGERRRPNPCGRPGYLRVDTVHQGDTDTRPGLYHINAVDTVTQWQVVGCCQTISEAHLLPVLEAILHQFPFRIRGFHSDNGSVSARGLPHALRKAGLTRRVGAALEAGHHGRFSRATDAADERYRMRPEHAATQEKAAGPVPLPLVNPRTTGRGLAAPDSAGMGGGGGSSTNAVDQGHTRLRFPPPRTPSERRSTPNAGPLSATLRQAPPVPPAKNPAGERWGSNWSG